ncbi:hypothetical protein PC129_g15931 [Phytophthora cactorum]|uniref:Uncharacterized protein n=1 Tax=Phytophthora cactorum TaxID=29920 RepID=A0A329SF86_9STRA|nr:hypothetical protein PC113_g17514 [Phytophthora cactorum]KAG2898402.1 hypothetical protein PC115_g16863 [Phytophthora cactorum]KAG2913113.1 hypothetical protein PC117_g18692 [Phytophthora cactorum]KAG2969615.1 hypothetical protein PC118_g17351 [Phytophthora cactorum]KAG2992207.1 hypothetical protein PC119_g18725 [Phytophthora cactorum]
MDTLYKYGTDENLLDVTTLTRSAFNQLLDRCAELTELDLAVDGHQS